MNTEAGPSSLGLRRRNDEEEDGEIVCPELRRLRVNWWVHPGVDDLWCVERCCLARASAGARLECLTTVKFPEIVLANLRHHVDRIEVLDVY